MDRAPWAVEGIEPTDRSRIIRTLELLEMGELEPREGESQLWTEDMRRPTLLAGLTMEREELYRRIDERVDAMRGGRRGRRRCAAWRQAGASRTARKALGFEELLAGDVEAMKRNTRRYAKRQLTWMRKLAGVHTIDVTGREPAEVGAEIAGAQPASARFVTCRSRSMRTKRMNGATIVQTGRKRIQAPRSVHQTRISVTISEPRSCSRTWVRTAPLARLGGSYSL